MAPERVLGRGDELAVISEVIGAFPDDARTLVLAGEAGIGKTVLWEAAERQARERGDVTVLTSRASAAESELAYVVLTDLLGPIAAAALSALPRPQAEALATALLLEAPRPVTPAMVDPRTIGTAVLGTLRAAAVDRPVLLAIDDAQWIDPASAAALEFALRRATELPIGVVLTIRTTTSTDARPSIATVLGERARTIEVGPISLGVLHHLVRDRTGAALSRSQLVRLEEASRGNPLLAIELARELARLDRWPMAGEPLPVPTDMAGLLGERLDRLSELQRAVLFVAASMSSPTAPGVTTVLGHGEPRARTTEVRVAIDDAMEAGLLEPTTGGRLRFGHPLMAEAALRAVSPVQARHLHARLADLATTPEDRGRHTALAADGPNAAAADAVQAAAQSARARGATAIAAGWAEAAARLTPDDDTEARAKRLIAAGRWFADAGEIDRARDLLERATIELPPGDTRATARLVLAQLAGWDGGPAAVVAGCEAAIAEARDPDLRARIRLRLAGEPDQLGFAASIANADAAVAELEAVDRSAVDRDLLACALLQSAQIRFEVGLGSDTAAIARATSLLADEPRRAADGDLRPESLRAHAIGWQWAADHDDFATGLAGALADIGRARDYGMDRPLAIGEAEVAYLYAWSGDLVSAGEHVQAALEAADIVGTRESRSAALGAVGVVALLGGDLDATEAAGRAGLALAADPADWLDARHQANLGAAALVRGHAAEATGILAPLFDRLVRLGARESNHRFAGDLVDAAVLAGDLARARGVVEVIEASAQIAPRPWVVVMAARGRAQIHAAEGDLDAADLAVREALTAAVDLPMPVERARTELIAGRIARRRKERRRAAEHLERAVEGFRSVGATAWVAIAEEDVARLGRRRGGGDTLTETEDRVARLAAGGLTNREVGEAAFLTAKSVEGVLARVYGKLGIRSRAELGAWLAEQGGAGREG